MKRIFERIILKLLTPLLLKIPLKNYIVLESSPDFCENTKYVFEELIRRGLNKKYKFFWIFHDKDSIKNKELIEGKNIYYLCKKDILKVNVVCCVAKLFLSCNNFLRKRRHNQYYLHLCHGVALKDCRSYSQVPEYVDELLTLSRFIGKYDAINFSCDENKMLNFGYPRNDLLFGEKTDVSKVFTNVNFKKTILWMPTYRQNSVLGNFSSISMPIIHNEESANIINDVAKQNDILIIVKPHFAQDVSLIKKMKLSNIVFIDNQFLDEKKIENYGLLRSVDALISDYSSVYYDYLLVNKPIGLCFEDFDEYNEKEGFTVNPEFILAGGEKLYNTQDFCEFIKRISNGQDVLLDKRQEICKIIHDNIDNESTKRVVDYLLEKLGD